MLLCAIRLISGISLFLKKRRVRQEQNIRFPGSGDWILSSEKIFSEINIGVIKFIHLNRIYTHMNALKNIGLSFLILLLFGSNNFASHIASEQCAKIISTESETSVQTPEILNHTYPVFLEIEGANSSQTITEVHRFGSIAILANRIVPVNYNFRSIKSLPAPVNVNSPVPIFIRGHALLN